MSYLINPFAVKSRAFPEPVEVRFVHLVSGISPRHSDTIDCVFWVGGKKVIVAISCAALTDLREREHQNLSDQQLAEIAALFLRRTLGRGYDATQAELFVGAADLRQLGTELGYLG